jgi:hypothetical protein
LEVSGRPVPAQARLSAAARARALPLAAFAAVVGAALAIVLAQPISSPWWTYADADAPYAASGLNLLIGQPTRYLDHPGLALEELFAVAGGVDATLHGERPRRYVDSRMLDLNREKGLWRGLAAAFYLVGAALSFLTAAALFRGWWWGLAGGLLWLGAPGLAQMSIQYRIDVPLAALLVGVAFCLARAMERRSAGWYAGAATLLGFTIMVKMHAAGAVPALALAALWRPPPEGWGGELLRSVRATLRRLRWPLAALVVLWMVAIAFFNHQRPTWRGLRHTQEAVLLVPVLIAAYWAAARTARGRLRIVLNPFYALLAACLFVGAALPATLVVDAGLQSFLNVERGLRGGGINSGIARFHGGYSLTATPLKQALVVFAIAGVAAAVALVLDRARDPVPVVLFAAALPLGVMATARLGDLHYYAPAYAVAVLAALWLFRRSGLPGAVAVVALLLYVVAPALQDRNGAAHDTSSFARRWAPTYAAIEQHLAPGAVALLPSGYPNADERYFELVQIYVAHTPRYPYRFLPASGLAATYASANGLRPRFYAAPDARPGRLDLAGFGSFTASAVPWAKDVVALR